MKLIVGVDIGNATTETAIARLADDNSLQFVADGIVNTTGIKGTRQNIHGILGSIKQALDKVNATYQDIQLIAINEAAPVIGDVAMETITETIITESTMIGHNPETPGGLGLGIGETVGFGQLDYVVSGTAYIVVVPARYDFAEVAIALNRAMDRQVDIQAAILQNDDGVLVNNRLNKVIPIVDEVGLIEKVPLGVKAAVEVASPGRVVEQLANPYGIATAFGLTPDETKMIVPIARALIGTRSAVVLKTRAGDVQEKVIPAGSITFIGESYTRSVNIDAGAEKIMETLEVCKPLQDIKGESGSHAGGMLERVRQVMANLTEANPNNIKIQDLLAVDTSVPQKVKGGLAGEFSMENAVGIAAMVQADRLQMQSIADELSKELNVQVVVGGIEADMAIQGALTTPGTQTPIAIIDMGAGSTDASIMDSATNIHSVHLAGAGNMVTLIIDTELGLDNLSLSEDIKKYPLAKVESLFHIRHEDGTVQFFNKSLPPELFSRVIILREEDMIPVQSKHALDVIRQVRRDAKRKVFVVNALRALRAVSPTGQVRGIDHVVLVGGSALDFEIPQLVTDALSHYGVVAGQGNIRGSKGPRNAVATGLVLTQARKV
ncbi:diol dehydratase reactivase subunit alpha [Entomomonas moraniae]|uniref:Diol dehydratase reactivase subunit alpha n=1 Tax=Entomomonas moraniae TaxID=2213226 RepID=A0A3S9XBM9_9GAMM|nr:diol dehydratase reactivase subunit alpha [Entomomonas moraniae]AZS49708.1 diol dehydratase reactivase subunit alpha [Entomomonas moraniae]